MNEKENINEKNFENTINLKTLELNELIDKALLEQCVECGKWIKRNVAQCNYCFIKFYGYPRKETEN